MGKKLIITADDYGMSQAVNDAINAGIEAGLITSTNVMTNMPFYQEAARLRKYPGVAVGLHWVLACGTPVAPAKEIPTLVTPEGTFYSYPEFRKRYKTGQIADSDIKKELIAQYRRFYDLLGQPVYWSAHQHTHIDFKLHKLFVNMACELKIYRMRSYMRIFGGDDKHPLMWHILEPIKSVILSSWQRKANKRGIQSPNCWMAFRNETDIAALAQALHNTQWKKHSIAEYVIHPANCNDSPYFGKIVEQRVCEYQMFTSLETREHLENAGISLITYPY